MIGSKKRCSPNYGEINSNRQPGSVLYRMQTLFILLRYEYFLVDENAENQNA